VCGESSILPSSVGKSGLVGCVGVNVVGALFDGVLAVSGGGYWSSSCRNDVLVCVLRVC
jgi:hypothetical protein